MRPTPLAALPLVLLAAGCGGSGDPVTGNPAPGPPAVELVARPVVTGLAQPVYVAAPPGDGRLFVVEQAGRVRVVKDGALLAAPFLDITPLVGSGGERGLLSIAFHPDYAANGWFFVNYTDLAGHTHVVRYRVSADPDVADAASASPVLFVEQPFANHNGGLVVFGPDGMLYVGMGDGGSGGDPFGNGQRLDTMLGKLLRLDVNGAAPYTVPPDNPFVGRADARPEIWAYGLRNPWRFAFDGAEGRLYVADVGQGLAEEVTVVAASEPAVNYGWNVMEGTSCYAGTACDRTGLRPPTFEYTHADGCSITGGYVYRGSIAALRGHYFYADYCRGWVRSIRVSADGTTSGAREWAFGSLGNVTSFGEDASGELYVVSANGTVYRVEER
ncbi:MAG TPA: PQQ-dependent sugar dehydrogenase [Gemmatimonadaceae bacterium]|nr:PQQ-dependent sugar dehydrogenase [Gemmatimonadaceae bacterium]